MENFNKYGSFNKNNFKAHLSVNDGVISLAIHNYKSGTFHSDPNHEYLFNNGQRVQFIGSHLTLTGVQNGKIYGVQFPRDTDSGVTSEILSEPELAEQTFEYIAQYLVALDKEWPLK